MPDPLKRLGEFRLNPEPEPQHTKRMGRVYSPEEVDAMHARIAELEAALRGLRTWLDNPYAYEDDHDLTVNWDKPTELVDAALGERDGGGNG